jgi:hypothetical protein
VELPDQEMELFLHFPVIGSKNIFNKNIPIWSNDFEIENVTLKRCSPSQPSAQICACYINFYMLPLYIYMHDFSVLPTPGEAKAKAMPGRLYIATTNKTKHFFFFLLCGIIIG